MNSARAWFPLPLLVKVLATRPGKAEDVVAMAQPVPEPVPVIRKLRNQVLTLSPEAIGVSPSPEHPHVWGVLMETGYAPALATLVCLADGTTSLYLGHGGGVIGGGEHASVRQAAQELLRTAEAHREALVPTKVFPVPDVGRVQFYVLTFSGVWTAEAEEKALGQRRHELFPLFYAGHGVLTQLRRIEERETQ